MQKKRIIWTSIASLVALGCSADLITSGSGSVSTPSAPGFRATAAQDYALRANQAGGDVFKAGAEIRITGTMTLVGDNDNQLNDKVGFAIGNSSESERTAQLNTAGSSSEASYALYASTTTTWPGENERYTLAKAGTNLLQNEIVETGNRDGSVAFAINLLFPDTFNNGVHGSHVYEYELGFDYNQDGTFEVIESGTFTAYEHDRIRFGFLVTKGAAEEAASLTNNFSYSIHEGFMVIPEPATAAMLGLATAGLFLLRRLRLHG